MSRKALDESPQSDPMMQWLYRHGFTANPFEEWEASKEERLESYFLPFPFFDKFYGDPKRPTTAFLFAGRGCGKSAHRLIIQARSRPHDPRSTVLAIPYTDDTLFLNDSMVSIPTNLNQHLQVLLKGALGILLDELTLRPDSWSQLLPDEQFELKHLYSAFAPNLLHPADLARRLARQTSKIPLLTLQNAIKQNTFESLVKEYSLSKSLLFVFWSSFLSTSAGSESMADNLAGFRRFIHLVRSLGIEALYVLVDGLEEISSSSIQQAKTDFLTSLITATPLLEMPHVAFKFMLPTSVGATIKQNPEVRADRFKMFDLSWDTGSLEKLLALRLGSFNKRGINSLKAMADQNGTGIDEELIRRAHGSPRALVLIGHLLFESHCANSSTPEVYLKMSELHSAVKRFNEEYYSLITTIPLLRVDQSAGVVAIGGTPLLAKLSKREFQVLEFLYRTPGVIRSQQQIIDAIGYDDNVDVAFDSMISRLRAKIEKDPTNPVYLVTERKRGYRLLNTETLTT